MAGKIELKAPLDGVVTIEPEDTASNFTVTIPAVTSTLVNEDSDIEAQVKTATNATGDAPIYACRAWVNFNGTGTVAIRASGNVSSITDNGVGSYDVNFTADMPDASYSVCGSCSEGTTASSWVTAVHTATYATSSCRLALYNRVPSSTDALHINVSIFR